MGDLALLRDARNIHDATDNAISTVTANISVAVIFVALVTGNTGEPEEFGDCEGVELGVDVGA